ncbi:phage holin family protein [Sphingomonas jeddahensis]|uniref:Holin-X, holin superfamily III n=1 Tax=Sphingomonas jeddahensis TaxID=1915074 RepID=A0A1V2EXG1_9SPHN|nr:phage holin family protein [Sphingomonas jeddahensis]ONF97187.1 hypothetical protein SPHI_06240 [Sphingomonas jeddahensis]
MRGERADLEEAGIGQLVSQLATDAREAAQAEVALVKARAGFAVTRYKWAVVYFGAAAVLALAALIALLVGLIMALAPLIGPGWATLAVVAGVLAVATILGLMGKAQLSKKVIS